MVYKGKVTGILNWETAGWFPEYWMYTREWESLWDAPELSPMLDEILDIYIYIGVNWRWSRSDYLSWNRIHA